jgi:hypothetical protein
MSEIQSLKAAELAFLALLLRHEDATGNVDAAVDEREWSSFYLALRKYYLVTREQLAAIQSEELPACEMPVVLHIARHAAVEPKEIAKLRRQQRSWADILTQLHLSSEIFYVGVAFPPGLTIGKPYGYYRQQARKAWRASVSTDPDIVNLVNLKFISEYYGYPPEQVIALRSSGWTFAAIHAELRRLKPAKRTAGKRSKAGRARR